MFGAPDPSCSVTPSTKWGKQESWSPGGAPGLSHGARGRVGFLRLHWDESMDVSCCPGSLVLMTETVMSMSGPRVGRNPHGLSPGAAAWSSVGTEEVHGDTAVPPQAPAGAALAPGRGVGGRSQRGLPCVPGTGNQAQWGGRLSLTAAPEGSTKADLQGGSGKGPC